MKDECWEWNKSLNEHGYGRVYVNGKQQYIHRAAWEKIYGKIPKGMCVCHTCDNRKCFNPDHLWLGTHDENMKDMADKEILLSRAARGEKQANAKFTEIQIKNIRLDYLYNNYSIHHMARMHSVSFNTMYSILKRKTWKHVN